MYPSFAKSCKSTTIQHAHPIGFSCRYSWSRRSPTSKVIATMSQPIRPKTPTSKVNTPSSSSYLTVASNDQQVQTSAAPTPVSLNFDDALTRTTRALQAGQTSLKQVQSECEELLRGSINHLKHDSLLKIASILLPIEIFSRIIALHGEGAIKYSLVSSRIGAATLALARSRGGEREDITREIEDNRRRSGAFSRAQERRSQNSLEIDRERKPARYGDGDGQASLAREKSSERAEVEPRAGRSIVDVGLSSVRRTKGVEGERVFGMDGVNMTGEMRPQPKDVRPQRSEIRPQAPELRPQEGDTQTNGFIPASGGNSTSRPSYPRPTSPLIRPLSHGAPFDLTPYSQPYAGTPLYVPGRREDGTVSWHDWLREDAEYMYPGYVPLVNPRAGRSSTGRADGEGGAGGI